MCIVSDKIKFCTCTKGSYQDLPHYWLLFRFNEQKDLQFIGMPIIPYAYLQPNFKLNSHTFVKRLNEADAFDKVIDFKPKDRMEIVINNLLADKDRMIFSFQFNTGKWEVEKYEPFELINRYDKLSFGDFDNLEKKD